MNTSSFFPTIQSYYTLWGNTIGECIEAIGIILGIIIIFRLFQKILITRLEAISKKTNTDVDDLIIKVIESFKAPFYYVLAVYAGVSYLTFPEIIDNSAFIIFIASLSYYGVQAVQIIVEYIIVKAIHKKEGTAVPMGMIRIMVKIIVWTMGVLFILSNLGIEITSLIAGLGIGGVAVALALQNILGDLFSSFAIYLDKPLEVGDFVVVGEHMGVVERIGIKTTRMRALQGEEIVISNKELTSTRIQNFKKMQKRRVVFSFGVVYATDNTKLKKIPSIVKEAVEREDDAEFDRSHFKEFGPSSLDFENVYYVLSGDYNEYMDLHERIILSIKEAFEKEEIEMAFPTRTIHMHTS